MEQIAPGIYVSQAYPGINVGFVVTADGAVAVDAPPLPADAIAWRQRILDVTGGPIRCVVLTDDHPDRLIGVGWLGAPVVAGRGTLQRLAEGGESLWRATIEDWLRRRPDAEELERATRVMPEIAVAGAITLHSSTPVVVEAVAGAAPGSVWVRLPEHEVLFTGDAVVVGSHPRLAEAPDTRAWLGTLVELRRARFPARTIVPGRGPVGGKDSSRDVSEYIQLARRRIRSLHNAGAGRGEVAGLTAEFLARFPITGEQDRARITRQVQAGLERVFEELRAERIAAEEP